MSRCVGSPTTPSVIDLFSGAGGLSGAFERAGFRTLAAIDLDQDCIATLKATQAAHVRIGKSRRCYLEGARIIKEDISDVNGSSLVPEGVSSDWRPDVLAGGPPCQPFSSAGAGLSLDDPRGQLFTEFVRLAGELKPRFVFFENVAGLVTAKNRDGQSGGVLQLIQKRFEEVGYACRFTLLNAADFGGAQRRVRLYMVATKDEFLPNFPAPTHAENGAFGLSPWVSLRDCLTLIPGPNSRDIVRPTGKRVDELRALRPGEGLRSNGIVEANRPSGHWGYRQDCFLADPNRPSRTIRAASTPDWLRTEEGLRRLTWRECAALQGFDRNWVFEGSRASRYRQIGNAVQGQVAGTLARHLFGAANEVAYGLPVSAPWPSEFSKRVRYTMMEQRVNGDHRQAARASKDLLSRTLCAAE